MARTCVTLSLDEETLSVWKHLPPRQRSARVRGYLRASSTVLTKPEVSALDSSKVHENIHKNVKLKGEPHKPHDSPGDPYRITRSLLEIPPNPIENFVIYKRRGSVNGLNGSSEKTVDMTDEKTVDLSDEEIVDLDE